MGSQSISTKFEIKQGTFKNVRTLLKKVILGHKTLGADYFCTFFFVLSTDNHEAKQIHLIGYSLI
jgi:hypothetical protein